MQGATYTVLHGLSNSPCRVPHLSSSEMKLQENPRMPGSHAYQALLLRIFRLLSTPHLTCCRMSTGMCHQSRAAHLPARGGRSIFQ